MNRICLIALCFLVGCVQVDNGGSPVAPVNPEVNDQFKDADATLVAAILAKPELNDAMKLRRYAALYKGASNVLQNQPDVPFVKVLSGISKATANFITPRSTAMQEIIKGLMPESGGAETDRPVVATKFASLSLACHAAAHKLDTQLK